MRRRSPVSRVFDGMRQRDLEAVVLQDGVEVEGGTARRADHLVQLGEAADRRGMADRQVVALHEVLGEHLPVGVPDVVLVEGLDIVLHAEVGDERPGFGQAFGDGRGVAVERHEDPTEPFLAADGRQSVVLAAEVAVQRHRRRATQGAIEVVGPGVIGADDAAHPAAAGQQRRHAVQADVGEGAQAAVAVAHHGDRLAGDVPGEVVAWLLQRGGAADAEPFAAEQAVELGVQKGLRGIDLGRHGAGFLERAGRGVAQQGDRVLIGQVLHRASVPFRGPGDNARSYSTARIMLRTAG